MAAAQTLISVADYFAHETKPASEYEDGVLRRKPMAAWDQGVLQNRIMHLLDHAASALVSASEVTVRIREGKYLVPDVIVQRRDAIQRPYPIEPVHLCVEILSPSDRISEALAKCEESHAWGVAMTWILDPEATPSRGSSGERESVSRGCFDSPGRSLCSAGLAKGWASSTSPGFPKFAEVGEPRSAMRWLLP